MSSWWVFAYPVVTLGGGQVGPGARPSQPARSQMAAGSRGSSPTTQTPETTLPFGGKWRRWGGQGLILQGGKCRGSREAGVPRPGSLGWQKGPWSQPCLPRALGWPGIRLLRQRDPLRSPGSAQGPLPALFLPRLWGRDSAESPGHPPTPPVLYHTIPHEMR